MRERVILIYAAIFSATALAWIWAFREFSGYPLLLGSALLAYTLGLRHAIDIDHLAAIDNVTRKLMQEGKDPLGVGLFFSLGHSSVVLLASALIAATSGAFHHQLMSFAAVSNTVGVLISAGFLLIISVTNVFIFRQIYRTVKRLKETGLYAEETINNLMGNCGFFSRILRRLFALISSGWQMFPVGFLFGLGFDTATEIAVLGIAAAGALKGISIWSIMVFPALFTAGMTLVDTTDALLMQKAYGWAFFAPARKLYYNLTLTGASVAVGLIVAGIETLRLF